MFLIFFQAAFGDTFEFDRVDFISEDRGMWVNHELPVIGSYPTRGAIRWVNQIKAVWQTPKQNLFLGLSVASQSIVYERPLPITNLYWSAGIQSQLLLPNGLQAGLAWRQKGFRLAVGMSLTSEARWSRIAYGHWNALPTIGFGYGKP